MLHMNKSFPHHPSQISTSVRRIHVSRSALTWREVTNARVVRDTSCCLGGDVPVRGCCATTVSMYIYKYDAIQYP